MAANCARGPLSVSLSATFVRRFRSFSMVAAEYMGSASPAPVSGRFSRHRRTLVSRFPWELGSAQSLMPLHSVTASALFNSMLSLEAQNWGWLAEGFELWLSYSGPCIYFLQYEDQFSRKTYILQAFCGFHSLVLFLPTDLLLVGLLNQYVQSMTILQDWQVRFNRTGEVDPEVENSNT